MTQLALLVETSRKTAATSSRTAKVTELAACLRILAQDEIEIGVAFLTGETRQGRIGASYTLLRAARAGSAAESPSLTLSDVDAPFAAFLAARGSGSSARRAPVLGALFLIVGELRQGALAGVMLDAIAAAARLPHKDVRRAAMYAGGLGPVARLALTEGAAGLARFQLQTLHPIGPMLAQTAEDVSAALSQFGEAALEWKLDGARIQLHKKGDDVRAYTRNLNDVSAAIPEIIETVRTLPARELVLDGEAIALDPSGSPRPFQTTMRRFGRKLDVASLRDELPLAAFFFDALRLDDAVLAERPARERFAALSSVLPARLLIPRLVTSSPAEAQLFVEAALARGHEGVMAKALDAPYEAGNRGASWLKIKPARTLDLVVLAAEWGHGRRRGWLSNLHLGARDPATGQFVMLGKTFKGMTDQMLAWQTQEFLAREIGRDDWTVYIRPELVVEIAFNNVQASPQYPGGLALRFARVKRYRPDKRAEQADTIDTVRGIYAA
ncbi:MAG: ATP-dependent DNA ligase [Gammaproteobacteria bacterium]|nr:MAG: ATP-dependent DNA ligase [Gammaproteobacteria bacterium]